MDLRFYLFGDLKIVLDARPQKPPPFRARSLLALLLLRPHLKRREQLADILFAEDSDRLSRPRLSDALYELRRACPYLPLHADRDTITFEPESWWDDVRAFRGHQRANTAREWLRAVELYQADLLVDHYDDWLIEEREALRLAFASVARRLRDDWMRRNEFQQALPVAERLVRDEPYDEDALRRLMQIYQAVGRRGQALRVYDRFVNDICPEIGLPPEPGTDLLARAIRDACPVEPTIILSDTARFDTADLLTHANAALLRGERAGVEAALAAVKQKPVGDDAFAARYLEIDLALTFDDIPRAERVLRQCDDDSAATCLRRALLAVANSQWSDAAAAAAQAILAANAAQDRKSEAKALWALALANAECGDRVQAYRAAEQALTLARRVGLPAIELDCLLSLGRMGLMEGRANQPGVYITEALALAQRHEYRPHYAQAKGLCGWLHHMEGRLSEAQQSYEDALTIYRDVGLARKEALLLNKLADTYDLLGQSRRSLALLQQAAAILDQLGDEQAMAINLYNQAFCRLFLADAEAGTAANIALQALHTFRLHQQRGWMAAVLVLIGFARWVDGRFAEGLAALQESLSLHDALHEREMFGEIMAHQVHCYLGLGQPTEALQCSQEAILALIQGARVVDIKTEVYFAHALALAANGQTAASMDYLRRAYRVLVETAALLQDEPARQAMFQRDPITRRLMKVVYERGIETPAAPQTITRWLSSGDRQRAARVQWLIDSGPSDRALKLARGEIAVRRARLGRLLDQARAQGIQPRVDDLAEALGVSARTIQRDLAHLRAE